MRTPVLALGACVLAAQALHAQTVTPPAPQGYTLVWHDEFDRDGLPDPARWT